MAIHWTEYPERVATFGDLFNIFETLEHDVRANLIDSGSCENESAESAYEVDLLRRGEEFVPRPERIPGWDELATFTERHLSHPPSLACLRQVRSMALEALDVPIATVNGMTIEAVVKALTEVSQRPAPEEASSDFLLAEYRWLKVKQIAALFALAPSQVTKLANAGTFVTNGKTEHDRRIDVLSVVRYTLDRLNQASASAHTDD